MRVLPPSQLPLCLVSLLGAALGACAFAHYVFEDAYITFRYAQNIGAGAGFVFNPGESVLGTSSPLWALALALASACGADIEIAADVLCGVSLAALALLGGRALRLEGAPASGVLFALCIVFGFGQLYASWGLETPGFVALTLGSIQLAQARRHWTAGLAMGAAALARHEGAVFAVALAAHIAWAPPPEGLERRVARSVRFALGVALVALPWFAFAWATFGTPLPHTLAAKAGDVGVLDYLLQSATALPTEWSWSRWLSSSAAARAVLLGLVAIGALAGAGALVRSRSALLAAAAGATGVTTGLAIIGTSHHFVWHRFPVHCVLLLMTLLGWSRLLSRWSRAASPPAGALALLALCALPSIAAAQRDRLVHSRAYQSRITAYEEVISYLRSEGLAERTLLTAEPGFIAFSTGVSVIDAAGLVTPGISFGSQRRSPTTLAQLLAMEPEMILARAPYSPSGYEVAMRGSYGIQLLLRE